MKLIPLSILAAGLAMPAAAATLNVTITNNAEPGGGLFFTPFLHVTHAEGSYTPFTDGSPASAGLEELAELGSTGVASTEASAQSTNNVIGTAFEDIATPGIFDPGNSASFLVDVTDTQTQLTLLSMIVPSNDTFIATTIDLAALFDDAGGLFTGAIDLDRSNVYDAGTEFNDPSGAGQAFNPSDGDGPGVGGTVETAENGNPVVHLSSDEELLTLNNQATGAGTTTNFDLSFFNSSPVTISFELVPDAPTPVPVPASALMLLAGLGGLGAMARRTKKSAAPSA